MTRLFTLFGVDVWLYRPRYWRTCFRSPFCFSRGMVDVVWQIKIGPIEIQNWRVYPG